MVRTLAFFLAAAASASLAWADDTSSAGDSSGNDISIGNGSDGDLTDLHCPDGWSSNQQTQGRNFCCPGGTEVDGDGVFCCVQPPATAASIFSNSSDQSCLARVNVDDANYTAEVSSALATAVPSSTSGGAAPSTTMATSRVVFTFATSSVDFTMATSRSDFTMDPLTIGGITAGGVTIPPVTVPGATYTNAVGGGGNGQTLIGGGAGGINGQSTGTSMAAAVTAAPMYVAGAAVAAGMLFA